MQKKSWNISRKDGDSGWAAVMEEGIPLDGYPSLDELYAAAEEKKIPRQALSSGKILEKELARARSFPGEFFSFPIIRPDGFDVRLSVSNDKLRAFLYVRKAADAPHTLDFKLIASVLNSSKIRFADPDLLKERLFQFRDSDEMELVDLPVAQGIPPSKGISAGLRENVKWLEGAEFAAIRRRISVWAENHIAEYGNLFRTPPEISSPGLKIGFVVQGDLALEFVCGEPGKPGVDIYGAAIPGLSEDVPVIHTDETLSVEPEGIRAGQHGAFLLEDSGNALFARILPYCDAYAELQPSADRMELFLTLCPAAGAGEPLTEERVRAAFSGQTAAAVQEFDRARIQALIREAETAGRECKTRIAQGTPAVPPGSPLVVWDASGPGGIVRKGGKILAYRVMEAGANGRDVLGNPIPFTGKEAVPVPSKPGIVVGLVKELVGTHINLIMAFFHDIAQQFHGRTDHFSQIRPRTTGKDRPFLFFIVKKRNAAGAAFKGRNCTSERDRSGTHAKSPQNMKKSLAAMAWETGGNGRDSLYCVCSSSEFLSSGLLHEKWFLPQNIHAVPS